MSPYPWPFQSPFAANLFGSLSQASLGGDEQNRTVDPLLARQVLSQLSYTPVFYRLLPPLCEGSFSRPSKLNNAPTRSVLPRNVAVSLTLDVCPLFRADLHRKEVIQPHLPIRLPCYDFTPVANPTFGSALLKVGLLTSGITGSHGVTGGVYKARERIHRGMLIRDY